MLPGLLGVVVQLGALVWYGGRFSARLEDLERRLDRLEQRLDRLFIPLPQSA